MLLNMKTALLFCFLGLLIMFHPAVFSGFKMMQTDPGDTRFINYCLEHSYLWLKTPFSLELWSPNFFFPAKNVLAYSDVVLGVTPFYAVWRAFGLGPEASFHAWMLSVSALNFFVFFWFLKTWFTKDSFAAAMGSFLFAFAASKINLLGHQQMLSAFYPVLALQGLGYLLSAQNADMSFKKKTLCSGLFVGSGILQLYSGYYYAWFLAFALLLAFLWSLVFRATRKTVVSAIKRNWLSLGVAVAVGGLAVSPLVYHYLSAVSVVGLRKFETITDWLPPIQAWFHMGDWSLSYWWLKKLKIFRMIVMEHEQRLGFGFISLVLVVIGLYRNRQRQIIRIGVLTALTMMILFTQHKGHSLLGYVYHIIPGAAGLRVYSRVALFFLILHGIGFALYFSGLKLRRKAFAFTTLLVLLTVAEQLVRTPAFEWKQISREVVELGKRLDPACESFIYTPVISNKSFGFSWKHQLDAMWVALEKGVPTWNGHSGNGPPEWPFLEIVIANKSDEERLNWAVNFWGEKHGLIKTKYCRLKPEADEITKAAEI